MSAEIERKSDIDTCEDETMNLSTRLLRVDNAQLVEDVVDTFRLLLKERHLLPPSQDDRGIMLRFLKAKGYDLDKAAHMWEKMIKWRRENGVDTIMQEFIDNEYEDVQSYYPQYFHGVDKKGRPVYIECVGKANCSKLKNVTSAYRFLRFHIFGLEKALAEKFPACSRNANKPINSMTRIVDLHGMGGKGYTRVATDLFNRMQKIDREYYPETTHETFCVNVIMPIRLIHTVVKFFYRACKIPFRTHRLGSQFQNKLLEVIDEDQLPAFLGGSCSCQGEGGCLRSEKGPWKDPGIMKAANVVSVPNLEQVLPEMIHNVEQALSGLKDSKNIEVEEEVNSLSDKLDEQVFSEMIHNVEQALPGLKDSKNIELEEEVNSLSDKLDEQVFSEMIHNVEQALPGLKDSKNIELEEEVNSLSDKLDEQVFSEMIHNVEQALPGLKDSKNIELEEEVNSLSDKLDEQVFSEMIHNVEQALPGLKDSKNIELEEEVNSLSDKLDEQVFSEMIHNVEQALPELKGSGSTALEEKINALSDKLDIIHATLNQLLVAKQQATN